MHFIDAPNNFYLGGRVNPDSHEVLPDQVVYYDARDLTTHAVILGMTGSGKTGLAVTLLEEAALDNIPLLILDPKGDITNMLLAFPDLEAQYFRHWVSPDDARRGEQTLDELAASVAQRWKDGLAEWGITNDRVQDYRHSARFSIYTPGSTAGLPISILKSFQAPKSGWAGKEEEHRERISGLVTAVLALIGVTARPLEDREHVLLTNIFEYNWRNGVDLSMESLIIQVQRPPFDKMGVLDMDMVFPEKDRFKLAQALNNIIAAPSFQNWMKGESLDIPSFLFTKDGYPRTNIFYLAHLNETERQFFITLFLNTVSAWMRGLSGTSSLRALLYIDEVYGMFPPYPSNPPSKEPIMRLLKQGRAFGLGLVAATQNPKDIDYKGLGNIGTWFIGKMQTDNDRERVLEGLDSSRDATSQLDMSQASQLIGRLGPREFLMHNVHSPETPILMKSRWSMSYLAGPLTRDQVGRLMENQRTAFVEEEDPIFDTGSMALPTDNLTPGAMGKASETGDAAAVAAQPKTSAIAITTDVPPGFSASRPAIKSSIYQYYLPIDYSLQQAMGQWEQSTGQIILESDRRDVLLYRPSLLAQSVVRFEHEPSQTFESRYYAFVVPNLPRNPYLDWGVFMTQPFDPRALDSEPFSTAFYGDLPAEWRDSSFADLQVSLQNYLYNNVALMAYRNPILKLYSRAGESRRDFLTTLQAAAREQRDAEVDRIALRYNERLDVLDKRLQRKMKRSSIEEEELQARKMEEMIAAGESIWQLVKGRAFYTLSRTSRLRRYTEASKAQSQFLEEDVQDLMDQVQQTEREMEDAMEAVQAKWTEAMQRIEEVRITPQKRNITMMIFGLGWVPYWYLIINRQPVILPASASGLSQAQGMPSPDANGGAAPAQPPMDDGPAPAGGRASRLRTDPNNPGGQW